MTLHGASVCLHAIATIAALVSLSGRATASSAEDVKAFGASLAVVRGSDGGSVLAVSAFDRPTATIRLYSLPKATLRRVITLRDVSTLIYPTIVGVRVASSTGPDLLLAGYGRAHSESSFAIDILTLEGKVAGTLAPASDEVKFGARVCQLRSDGKPGPGHVIVNATVVSEGSKHERFIVFDLATRTRQAVFDGPKDQLCLSDGVGVCSLTDVDRDGYSDFAVECGGVIHIVSTARCNEIRKVGLPRPAGSRLGAGMSVVSIPDIDADRVDDLAIGVPNTASGQLPSGEVRLISAASGAMIRAIRCEPSDSGFGFSMDVLYGRSGESPSLLAVSSYHGAFEGGVSVVSPIDGKRISAATWTIDEPPQLGWRVLAVGDIDGDGFGDYASSRYTMKDPGGADQEVYLYSGQTGAQLNRIKSPFAE